MHHRNAPAIRRSFAAALVAAALVTSSGALIAARPAQAAAKPSREAESRFADAIPADAQEVSAAITSAKTGETITLRGRVPHSKDAIDGARAVFILVDDDAAEKSVRPKDAELPATSDAVPGESKVTVRLVDPRGSVLPESLSGRKGLKPGAEVFVTGTVENAGGEGGLVVNAKSIHVPKVSLPPGFFTQAQPEGAKDVSEARSQGGLKVGDRVVLRGRIGGSADPFVEGRAVFTLMGSKLKACNENPDDNCSKPWDYCCEPKEAILANSATVQVVDGKGAILKTGIKGRRGIKELSEVVVVGTVAAADKALVVNATQISVSRP